MLTPRSRQTFCPRNGHFELRYQPAAIREKNLSQAAGVSLVTRSAASQRDDFLLFESQLVCVPDHMTKTAQLLKVRHQLRGKNRRPHARDIDAQAANQFHKPAVLVI